MLQCFKNNLPNQYKWFYLENRYFPPSWYIHLLYFFFSEKYIFSSAEQSELIQLTIL